MIPMKKFLLLLPLVLLAACNSSGDQFIGKWKRHNSHHTNYEVRRNGADFLFIAETRIKAGDTAQFPAKVDGNNLVVTGGFGPSLVFTIDQKTGHMVGGGEDLEPVK